MVESASVSNEPVAIGDSESACITCGAPPSAVTWPDPVDYEYGVHTERQFAFLACETCGCEWLSPRPTTAELVEFYPDDYHAYNDDHGLIASALVGLRARLRERQYRSWIPEGGSLFDIGAGDCRHFQELDGCGFHFAGVEINPRMAEEARRAGFDVETGTLEEMDLERHCDRYDAVSMNHLLEHVLDPIEVLERSHRILNPGGWVVGQIPTLSTWERRAFGGFWAGYHYPRHLQIFTRDGLSRLLERCGFTDVRITSTPHIQASLSAQNWLVGHGYLKTLRMGRSPLFGILLLLSLPVEALAALFGRSGVVDFTARRPETS